MTGEVNKDLVFAQPSEPVKRYGYPDESGKTRPRDWTVAEIEEVMWRVRAAGGTDSTPVKFSYRAEESIKALHVEASPVYEVPRRREPVCKACDDLRVLEGTGRSCPVCSPEEREWWYRPAQALGLLLALPLVLSALALAWGVFFGVIR